MHTCVPSNLQVCWPVYLNKFVAISLMPFNLQVVGLCAQQPRMCWLIHVQQLTCKCGGLCTQQPASLLQLACVPSNLQVARYTGQPPAGCQAHRLIATNLRAHRLNTTNLQGTQANCNKLEGCQVHRPAHLQVVRHIGQLQHIFRLLGTHTGQQTCRLLGTQDKTLAGCQIHRPIHLQCRLLPWYIHLLDTQNTTLAGCYSRPQLQQAASDWPVCLATCKCVGLYIAINLLVFWSVYLQLATCKFVAIGLCVPSNL